MLVEPSPDEEACRPRSPCNITRMQSVVLGTLSIAGGIPLEDVCVGVDKLSEAIKKKEKEKRSTILKTKNNHDGCQLINPNH